MPKTPFRIITLGCKVNQYESAYLRESLIRGGGTEADKDACADVVIVNTCIVTNEASCQSRQALRKAIRENPGARIIAVGCYAEMFPDELHRIKGMSMVAGNALKGRLPGMLLGDGTANDPDSSACSLSQGIGFERLPVRDFGEKARAFLKIQDGCQSYCSYCIVPYARGPLRSLPAPEILQALESMACKGYREVVLTGIHLGKYGVDLSPAGGLKTLLRRIGKEKLPIRIRLSSVEPNEVDQELVETIASEEWLCRHLHIPLQSGDDGILQSMRRRYGAREFAALIERIHREIPLAAIGADVMVGFPGEDGKAFENTCSLIRDLPLSYLHVFPFSAREGTPAAEFPDVVSPSLKKERARELRGVGQAKRKAFCQSCEGREFVALVEGTHPERPDWMNGLTDNYLPVTFASTRTPENALVHVMVHRIQGRRVTGVLVEEPEETGHRLR